MSTVANGNGSSSRFRLAGIEQVGYAQLSLIETALYPLDAAASQRQFFVTGYDYTDATGERRRAEVKLGFAFEPLKPNDDYVLWSLLSLTLRHSKNNVLTATPYWLLKNLGMPTGGHDYLLLRQAVERLAEVVYHNTGFYNPIAQVHERWTFSFFSSRLPTSLDADRLWRITWPENFMEVCRATGGRLLFDLEFFRKLGSPATRRLFLKLSDRFYRSSRVHLEVDDLTINGLGYSPTVPLKVRKQKLTRCIETLLEKGIVVLGTGHATAKHLFLKRGKGRYVVVFFRGPYFEQPIKDTGTKKNVNDDPLFGPIKSIGVDEPMVGRLLTEYSRGVIERWLRITEAAMKDKPAGFPGFKVSPAAFFVDGVTNGRMPPDWMYQMEKSSRLREWEAEAAKTKAAERLLLGEYQQQRRVALKAFLETDQGKQLYLGAFDSSLALWEARGEPHPIARQRATEDATAWTERCDEFTFQEFPVWMLARQSVGN